MGYYASIKVRAIGAFIDFSIYIFIWILLVIALGLLTQSPSSSYLPGWPFLGLWFLYFPLAEGIGGKTLGKRIMGIRVVKLSGNDITVWDSLVRHLFDSIDYLFFGLIGILVTSGSPKKQRIGDQIANTLVINDILIPCKNCGEKLTLSPNEFQSKNFNCPVCHFENISNSK